MNGVVSTMFGQLDSVMEKSVCSKADDLCPERPRSHIASWHILENDEPQKDEEDEEPRKTKEMRKTRKMRRGTRG